MEEHKSHEAQHHEPHRSHVPPPAVMPESGPHPEEVDPLGKAYARPQLHPDEKHTVMVLSIALVATLIFIPIISVVSASPLLNVFLGLSPLLLTLILDIVATMRHYKTIVYWLNLVIVHVLALAVLYLLNLILITPLNVGSSVSLSAMLAVAATIIATFASVRERPRRRQEQAKHTVEFKPERIQEYVQSIEDKVKGLNFAIGRVYRASNGGTPRMRERLRIPSEWYNEFNSLRDADVGEQLDQAKVLVRKIRDRLSLFSHKEKEVFSHDELANLKNIVRDKAGEDTVLTVLKTNDNDPVENYHASAVDFCDRILEELERK